MEQAKEIIQLRTDMNNLRDLVENLVILMNRRLMKELYGEAENIVSGEYLTEEEFEERHRVKID